MPGLGIVPVPNGKQDTPHWGNSFTARVTQVVYAGSAVRSGIRLAELGREMAQLDVERNRQEVRFLLAGYYLDLSKLGNQMEMVRQNIALTLASLFLLLDIPAVRTNIRKVPRWPVYAIEYLGRRR